MRSDLPDHLLAGVLGGVLAALLGYVLFGTAWGWLQGESLAYFHKEVFMGSPIYKDRILSLCVLSIVPFFHLAFKWKKDQFARGTLLVMILLVLFIVWLQYGE